MLKLNMIYTFFIKSADLTKRYLKLSAVSFTFH